MITRTRPVVAFILLLVALGVLSGCAPQPEPEPTPSAVFSAEDEAIAEAEEAYLAFTSAENARRDGDSTADPKALLIGVALEQEIASLRYFDEQGITLRGHSIVASFEGKSASITGEQTSVVAKACIDITRTSWTSTSGTDVTPSEREPVVDVEVSFVEKDGRMLIESVAPGGFEC